VTTERTQPTKASSRTDVKSGTAPRRDAARRRPGWELRLAVVLAVFGLMTGGWALANQQTPPSIPLSDPAEAALVAEELERLDAEMEGVDEPAAGAASGPLATEDRIDPDRITIRTIGVDAPIVQTGLEPDGRMEAPSTSTDVGWYSPGPAPGQVGPALMGGHVDGDRGAAVFFRLAELTRGDGVVITRGDGTRLTYSVMAVHRFERESFPIDALFGPTDFAALRLITCGGEFDSATGHYPDNVVVSARLVSID
jgi:sortase (surface protein transpeptidase)